MRLYVSGHGSACFPGYKVTFLPNNIKIHLAMEKNEFLAGILRCYCIKVCFNWVLSTIVDMGVHLKYVGSYELEGVVDATVSNSFIYGYFRAAN